VILEPALLAGLVEVLDKAWQGGIKSRSDMARARAEVISMATERSLLTTRVGPSTYTDTHLITPSGLEVLWSLRGLTK
jgi:hypothetical protein